MNETNNAYDFSLFEPKPKNQTPQIRVIEGKKKTPYLATLKTADIVRLLLCAAVIIAVVSMMIYNRVVITELNAQIDSYNTKVTKLQSEYVTMQAQIDSKLSLRNVEQYASENLGMSKLEEYQVRYLESEQDSVIVRNEENIKHSLTDRIGELWRTVTEYVGAR